MRCAYGTIAVQSAQYNHARRAYNTVATRANRAEIDRLGEFADYVAHVGYDVLMAQFWCTL